MFQSLMRVFRQESASLSDVSKASELVLTLDIYRDRTDSGSPEFTVRRIIPHRILHINNPSIRNKKGYEFVGCMSRSEIGNSQSKLSAHIVCGDKAWALFRRGKSFTGILCTGETRGYVCVRPHAASRYLCSDFPLESFGKTEVNLAHIG